MVHTVSRCEVSQPETIWNLSVAAECCRVLPFDSGSRTQRAHTGGRHLSVAEQGCPLQRLFVLYASVKLDSMYSESRSDFVNFFDSQSAFCLSLCISQVNTKEIEDARWFTRAEVGQMLQQQHPQGLFVARQHLGKSLVSHSSRRNFGRNACGKIVSLRIWISWNSHVFCGFCDQACTWDAY